MDSRPAARGRPGVQGRLHDPHDEPTGFIPGQTFQTVIWPALRQDCRQRTAAGSEGTHPLDGLSSGIEMHQVGTVLIGDPEGAVANHVDTLGVQSVRVRHETGPIRGHGGLARGTRTWRVWKPGDGGPVDVSESDRPEEREPTGLSLEHPDLGTDVGCGERLGFLADVVVGPSIRQDVERPIRPPRDRRAKSAIADGHPAHRCDRVSHRDRDDRERRSTAPGAYQGGEAHQKGEPAHGRCVIAPVQRAR